MQCIQRDIKHKPIVIASSATSNEIRLSAKFSVNNFSFLKWVRFIFGKRVFFSILFLIVNDLCCWHLFSMDFQWICLIFIACQLCIFLFLYLLHTINQTNAILENVFGRCCCLIRHEKPQIFWFTSVKKDNECKISISSIVHIICVLILSHCPCIECPECNHFWKCGK